MTAETSAFRQALVQECGRCDWCREGNELFAHEISRGQNRQRSLDNRACLLVLCSDCHAAIHRMAGDDQRALGLALLRRSRPLDYSIGEFWRVTARRWPAESLVRLWARRLGA